MAGRVYAVPVLPPAQSNFGGSNGGEGGNAPNVKPSETIKQFWQFVQYFRVNETWIYRFVCYSGLCILDAQSYGSTNRDRLRVNLLAKLYVLDVDLDHLIAYNEDLAHRIVDTPAEVLPLVCALRNGVYPSAETLDSSRKRYEDQLDRFLCL